MIQPSSVGTPLVVCACVCACVCGGPSYRLCWYILAALAVHPLQLDEFQREMSSAFGTNSEDIISQARSWEQGAEYRRAVETYLKLSVQNCGDHTLLVKVWMKVSLHSTQVPSRGVFVEGAE